MDVFDSLSAETHIETSENVTSEADIRRTFKITGKLYFCSKGFFDRSSVGWKEADIAR